MDPTTVTNVARIVVDTTNGRIACEIEDALQQADLELISIEGHGVKLPNCRQIQPEVYQGRIFSPNTVPGTHLEICVPRHQVEAVMQIVKGHLPKQCSDLNPGWHEACVMPLDSVTFF